MLTPDQMAAAMGAIRDQIVRLMHDHEDSSHDGKVCYGNRASALAYIGHCLGVRGDVWDYAAQLRREYDAECKGAEKCRHEFDGSV